MSGVTTSRYDLGCFSWSEFDHGYCCGMEDILNFIWRWVLISYRGYRADMIMIMGSGNTVVLVIVLWPVDHGYLVWSGETSQTSDLKLAWKYLRKWLSSGDALEIEYSNCFRKRSCPYKTRQSIPRSYHTHIFLCVCSFMPVKCLIDEFVDFTCII